MLDEETRAAILKLHEKGRGSRARGVDEPEARA